MSVYSNLSKKNKRKVFSGDEVPRSWMPSGDYDSRSAYLCYVSSNRWVEGSFGFVRGETKNTVKAVKVTPKNIDQYEEDLEEDVKFIKLTISVNFQNLVNRHGYTADYARDVADLINTNGDVNGCNTWPVNDASGEKWARDWAEREIAECCDMVRDLLFIEISEVDD